jgi:hypothetical protein
MELHSRCCLQCGDNAASTPFHQMSGSSCLPAQRSDTVSTRFDMRASARMMKQLGRDKHPCGSYHWQHSTAPACWKADAHLMIKVLMM